VLDTYWLLSGCGQRTSRAMTALALLLGVLFILLIYFACPTPPSRHLR
jgi:hypothetical protein